MQKLVKDKHITVRIPDEIREELRRKAEDNTRTISAQVLHYIKIGLENSK